MRSPEGGFGHPTTTDPLVGERPENVPCSRPLMLMVRSAAETLSLRAWAFRLQETTTDRLSGRTGLGWMTICVTEHTDMPGRSRTY